MLFLKFDLVVRNPFRINSQLDRNNLAGRVSEVCLNDSEKRFFESFALLAQFKFN